ncbi:TPA: ABC transporter permease [Candidatus Poribacteria bacterium]|nr:ABC transporter permease [Candidatus Poribacteria bacterium]HIB98542.1 ABC transporter permease [Candidatus Poribacteria bacterium]HIC16824.1 ABC transporter permease [Candidatus Poribacteria bacterium]HIO09332.1 ABC transporter permease [Candidatus Poribacteria bacterium]
MLTRINGLVLRYLYLYRRSLARAGEIFFWPIMDLLVWGFVSAYINKENKVALFLLGSVIFWDVLYRSQQAITLSISEDIWVKNILNVFVSPVSIFELMVATCIMGIIKAAITAIVLGSLAFLLYTFNIVSIGILLLPFLISLLLFGWALGMVTMALILRFGKSAEALVWGVPFLIQPFSAVFYPVEVLPDWLQIIAYTMPSTYVFEGMRKVLANGEWLDLKMLVIAFSLNILYLATGATFFGWMFSQVRKKGYLSRIGME